MTTDSRRFLPAGTELDRKYIIERVIGAGGFGVTYAAHDIGLSTTVALKEYYPANFGTRDASMSVRPRNDEDRELFEKLRQSFVREARTLAQFRHPAIVRVLSVFEAHGTAYMAMQYEDGQSLKAWMRDLGRLPTQEELDRITGPLLDALEVLHRANFLHRDIAPDNIILRNNGTPVLLDFGAARRVLSEATSNLTGVIKQGYSPQEQYATESRLQGPWTDIYALGATLYHAVTGAAPQDAMARTLDDALVSASQLGAGRYRPSFLAGIDAALLVKLKDRPQSIQQLRSILSDDDIAPGPIEPLHRARTEVLPAATADRVHMGLSPAATAPATLPPAAHWHAGLTLPGSVPPPGNASSKAATYIGAALVTVLVAAGIFGAYMLGTQHATTVTVTAPQPQSNLPVEAPTNPLTRHQETAPSPGSNPGPNPRANPGPNPTPQPPERQVAPTPVPPVTKPPTDLQRDAIIEEARRRAAAAERDRLDRERRETDRRSPVPETAPGAATAVSAWERVRRSNSADVLREFERNFPGTHEAEQSRVRRHLLADEEWRLIEGTREAERVEGFMRRHPDTPAEERARSYLQTLRQQAATPSPPPPDFADIERRRIEQGKRNRADADFVEAVKLANGTDGVTRDYARALPLFERSAARGNPDAQNWIGWLHFHGRGVPQDYARAREWYEKAAAAGHPTGLNQLGWIHHNGFGVPRNLATALTWYQRAASAGSIVGMYNLGSAYQHGRGTAPDLDKAREWYEIAASQGDASSMSQMGWLNQNGLGIPVDYGKAREWYEKAANAGSASGMNQLGWLYQNGLGQPRDYAKAREWYEKAAALGNGSSMNQLGWLYGNGFGVARDLDRAREWYEKAANAGNTTAMYNLASAYENGQGVPRDYVKARTWYEKAAAAGDSSAMSQMGWLYQNGLGTLTDYQKAREWYEKAAAAGNGTAMNQLGWMHQNSLGVAQDYGKAREWYERAAAAGNGSGMNQLGWIHANGLGVTKDLVKARAWYERAAAAGKDSAIWNLALQLDQGIGGVANPVRAAQLLLRAVRLGHETTLKELRGSLDNWERQTRTELKRELQRLGHYQGPVDDHWSDDARRAIEALRRAAKGG